MRIFDGTKNSKHFIIDSETAWKKEKQINEIRNTNIKRDRMFYSTKAAKSESNKKRFSIFCSTKSVSSFIPALSSSNTFRDQRRIHFRLLCHWLRCFEMDFPFVFIFKFNNSLFRFHIFTFSRTLWMWQKCMKTAQIL